MRLTLVIPTQSGIWPTLAQQIAGSIDGASVSILTPETIEEARGLPDQDVVVYLHWYLAQFADGHFPGARVIVAIHDYLSWSPAHCSTRKFAACVGAADILAFGTDDLPTEIAKVHDVAWGKPRIIVEGGVDTQWFSPQPLPQEFTVGIAGWTFSDDHKGFGLVRTACERVGAPLLEASKIPADQMREWYGRISVLVCASRSECAPNPVLEAMACGRPVVSTRVGLVPQLVDEQSGVIVERTEVAIAQALADLRGLPRERLEAMGAAARSSVERFDWPLKMAPWAQAIQALAAKGRKVGPSVTGSAQYVCRGVAPARDDRPMGALLADVETWAFDIAHWDCDEALPDIHFGHYYVARDGKYVTDEWPDLNAFDFVYVPYHRWPIENRIPWEKALGSLRARWFTPERPGVLTPKDISLVRRFRAGFNVVTKANQEELAARGVEVTYLTNPVAMHRFPKATEAGPGLVACWNGSAKHASGQVADVKGLGLVVRPACTAANVPLLIAEYNTPEGPERRRAPEEMPAFYQGANVALCASLYEGASSSVMEAMASGLAVIATDVGNHGEMHRSMLEHLGESGIMLVERKPEALAEALRCLARDPGRVRAMGQANRAEIAARWSWKAWAPRFREFFLGWVKGR